MIVTFVTSYAPDERKKTWNLLEVIKYILYIYYVLINIFINISIYSYSWINILLLIIEHSLYR